MGLRGHYIFEKDTHTQNQVQPSEFSLMQKQLEQSDQNIFQSEGGLIGSSTLTNN